MVTRAVQLPVICARCWCGAPGAASFIIISSMALASICPSWAWTAAAPADRNRASAATANKCLRIGIPLLESSVVIARGHWDPVRARQTG